MGTKTFIQTVDLVSGETAHATVKSLGSWGEDDIRRIVLDARYSTGEPLSAADLAEVKAAVEK